MVVTAEGAALALAVFLARFWSSSVRLVSAFPIDRRELADRADLGLTEAQVRGAIRALETAGFLDRTIPGKGSRHKLTGAGELHRRPVLCDDTHDGITGLHGLPGGLGA